MSLNPRRRLAGVALVALLIAPVTPALASTFLETDLTTLAGRSEAVVHGLVLSAESSWNEDHTLIFTEVTVEVARTYRGQAPAIVTLRVPGGSVDGYAIRMYGGPEFPVDKEVIVFLDRWPDGAYKVTGYHMGLSGVRVVEGRAVVQGGLAHGLPLEYLRSELQKATPEFKRQLDNGGIEP